MHACVPRKSLKALRHIDQAADLFIGLIERFQLRVHRERFIDRDAQLHGDHLRDRIAQGIRQIHDAADIPDHAPGCQRTEGNDLGHPVPAVFPVYIINDFLSPLEAEVHVNIGHGYALGVQEPLKEQLIADRVELCDAKGIGDDASRRGSSSRADHDIIFPGVADVIPDDQEIIHIPHLLNDSQLIIQPLLKFRRDRIIPLRKSFPAELVQVFPGCQSIRHIKFRQLCHSEFNVHMAPLGNFVCILESFRSVGEQSRHLLRRFHVVLAALIAHAVLI